MESMFELLSAAGRDQLDSLSPQDFSFLGEGFMNALQYDLTSVTISFLRFLERLISNITHSAEAIKTLGTMIKESGIN